MIRRDYASGRLRRTVAARASGTPRLSFKVGLFAGLGAGALAAAVFGLAARRPVAQPLPPAVSSRTQTPVALPPAHSSKYGFYHMLTASRVANPQPVDVASSGDTSPRQP